MKRTLAIFLAATLCAGMGTMVYAEAPADAASAEEASAGESAEEAGASSGSLASPVQENQLGSGMEGNFADVDWKGEDGYLFLDGAKATVGGEAENYEMGNAYVPVTEKYYSSSAVNFDGKVNSKFTTTHMEAGGAGNTFTVTGEGSELYVDNIYALAAGSQTPVFYTDGTNDKMVITDSYIEAAGSVGDYTKITDFIALQGLLSWGHTRTNLSQGQTSTYYYNSAVVADGWAAMSTDGATGLGVNFVSVNSYAEVADGGYAIYSDHECRDYVFGTTIVGAEYGGIIAAGGELYLLDGDALDMENQELNAWRNDFFQKYPTNLMETSYQDFAGEHPVVALEEYKGEPMTVGRSALVGGRNCLLMHKPDEAHEGVPQANQNVFVAIGTDLIVDKDLFVLEDMPEGWYTPQDVTSSASMFKNDTLNYVLYTSGSGIVIRSCSNRIYLEDVTFQSNYDEKVLVHAVLNSDGNANLIPDGEVANPMDITIAKSTIEGDIIDEDYQREMLITLDEATLTGKIDWKNVDDWNATWGVNGTIGTGDYVYDETYETVWGPVVTLTNGSTWVVTEESYIKGYEVDETSQIIGTIEEAGNGYIVKPVEE